MTSKRKEKRAAGARRRSPFRLFLRLIEYGFYLTVLAAGAGFAALVLLVLHFSHGLPSLEPLQSYAATQGADSRWNQATQIFAADGTTLIGEFYEEDRLVINGTRIPMILKKAIIAVEDERFDPNHPTAWVRVAGIDPFGIARAALANLKARRNVQGGSTITQQLAKNLFLTPEKTFRRKIQEMILAYRIERNFSKSEIMERYLNKVFFGNHAYGVASAASRYFGVDLEKPDAALTIGQAAMLAGLPKAPSDYAPHRNRERAEGRMKVVLNRMVACGYLKPEEVEPAFKEFWESFAPNRVSIPDTDADAGGIRVGQAGFFLEYVRQELLKHFDDELLKKGGLRIRTTLDPTMQSAAEAAMKTGLERLTRDLRARRISLAKGPLEGALVAIDQKTGYVLAMVGGSSWSDSNQFNRAVQARRQAGSSFKPFVYFTALESGDATLGTVLRDETFEVPGTTWTPKNYDGKDRGPVLPRTALAHSFNISAVRMLLLTSPERVLEKLSSVFGINTSRMNPYPSIALGAFEVTLLEMVSAYSVFANYDAEQPVRVTPFPIISVTDRDGNAVLDRNDHPRKNFEPFPNNKVPSPEASFLTTTMLQSVVRNGTAASAVGARIGRIPAAGKTGTTDDYADAWFVGFTPTITAGVWVGFDERRTMGSGMTGGKAAGTIWADFIKAAYKNLPVPAFPPPPKDIIQVEICPLTGLRPSPDCLNPISEFFINRTTPFEFCAVHSDPWRLQEFLYGEKALDTALITWPDRGVSLGAEAAMIVESRERLQAIIDAEAPAPPAAPQ